MTRLRLVFAIASFALGACGDDADVRTVTVTGPAQEAATAAPLTGNAILIETRITDAKAHTGEVLEASVIGEEPFCRGGTSTGGSEGATITSTFECDGGTLKVSYAPTQRSLVQGATWEIVSGTGDFEGLRGGGSMIARFDGGDPDVGGEIFAGTLTE